MLVVSNTSPILGLAAIGELRLLQRQFTEVLIPKAVQLELKAETDFRGTSEIRQALKSNWLKVSEVKNTALVQALALELDQGEAEAIALALETDAELILMDEHEGREKARALGLQTTGVLGILLRAKKEGQIKSIAKTMQALRKEIGFFITDELYQRVLEQADE